ncbi:hypothetical protein DPMN_103224 [Dreissena polymorpha]|uniref:Uncharacterized protein n=1 Tax=Dreissena polymorpha TaxID=45954 RepID=A0A9D4H7N0_DREPO|nr:hypothetical protein DPMN_103224 [Dreissena polymorpha]
MSGESAGDSGKGGSDDDLQINNLSFPRDGDLRFKDRWNTGRHSASACQLSSFPTRYTQPNNTLTHQKIVPFSFKKTPSYSGNGLINNLAPQPSFQMTATTGYSVPTYYDDESRSSSGFHSSIDSSSNMHINNFRNGKLYLNRAKVSDCVV